MRFLVFAARHFVTLSVTSLTTVVMDLTLQDAANRLGKSLRQLRSMVKEGRLKTRKVGGRWFIVADDLPQSAPQQQAAERHDRQLRTAVEDALGLDSKAGPAKRYSVRDLKAFQIGLALHRRAHTGVSPTHAA